MSGKQTKQYYRDLHTSAVSSHCRVFVWKQQYTQLLHQYAMLMDAHMTVKDRLWAQTLRAWHHTSMQVLTKTAS